MGDIDFKTGRIGLKPWPKLFQNLRAARQKELVKRHAIHVACNWLGNCSCVADWRYLQVTEADFASDYKSKAARSRLAGTPAGWSRRQAAKKPEKMQKPDKVGVRKWAAQDSNL
jgi:hypothetical protein